MRDEIERLVRLHYEASDSNWKYVDRYAQRQIVERAADEIARRLVRELFDEQGGPDDLD